MKKEFISESSQEQVLLEIRDQVHNLYGMVLDLAGSFSSKLSWITIDVDKLSVSFQELEELNPSADRLAVEVRKLCSIVQGLSELIEYDYTVENLYINASQCALHLELVARAIEARDLDQLADAVKRLSS